MDAALLGLLIGGCGGPVVGEEALGSCAEVPASLSLSGLVLDADWQPVADAEVRLEEVRWDPGAVLGEVRTDPDGSFVLALHDVPMVDGCWDAGPAFHVVATEGARSCEVPATLPLLMAHRSDVDADLDGYPCVLSL